MRRRRRRRTEKSGPPSTLPGDTTGTITRIDIELAVHVGLQLDRRAARSRPPPKR